eukprot:365222-Chlamydomonas_euryale.AAC.15
MRNSVHMLPAQQRAHVYSATAHTCLQLSAGVVTPACYASVGDKSATVFPSSTTPLSAGAKASVLRAHSVRHSVRHRSQLAQPTGVLTALPMCGEGHPSEVTHVQSHLAVHTWPSNTHPILCTPSAELTCKCPAPRLGLFFFNRPSSTSVWAHRGWLGGGGLGKRRPAAGRRCGSDSGPPSTLPYLPAP